MNSDIASTEATLIAQDSARIVPSSRRRGIPRWVQIGSLLIVGLPNVVTGLWAVIAPRHWFDHFPGFGPLLVAAEPPFNTHLATDAGVGFLAPGVAVVIAAVLARPDLLIGALGISFVAAVPHVAFHSLNPASGLTDSENAANTLTLAFGLGMIALFAWGTLRRSGEPDLRQMPDMHARSPRARSL